MCQCLICGCWWYNVCGVCCGGCHDASLIYSCWLCKPDDLRMLDPECCHLCACDGFGFNFINYGSVCCAPKAVREWSALHSIGRTPADLNSNKTILINNNAPPSPIYMQQMGGNYQTNMAMNGNYSAGINMNGNMGGVQMNSNMSGMNMNVNMGGMGMNNNMNMGMGMNTNMGNMGMNGNMGGMRMNNNMGMGNPNMNMNNGGMNMNTKMNTPGVNAKISF